MRIKRKIAYKFAIAAKAWYNTVQKMFFHKKERENYNE